MLSIQNLKLRFVLCATSVLAGALLPAVPAKGAIILTVNSTTGKPGDVGDFFDVSLSNSGPASVSVGGFLFRLSVNNANITFTSATIDTTVAPYIFAGHSLFGNPISASAPGQTLDAGDVYDVSNSGVTIASGATVGLGHVFFDVAPATPTPTTATVSFVGAGTSVSDASGKPVTITTLTPGSIVINNVPEPATLGLMGLALAAIGFRKRFRSRSV